MRAAAGLNSHDALGGKSLIPHQEFGIFAGINVIGDHSQAKLIAQPLTQAQDQHGFARADRPTNSDAQYLHILISTAKN
jgi:hypothetical protein